ncbi:MAG: Isochorismatase hydrolase [Lasallia pustulata]|uniref:Isochorismatase hydrolase n=2 Tax=Lasallia pustulata TaxID=136370 RepID=A0A5M8PZC8_9LECA|nr:MAG: Isochorismatase hydrolase [Lasallia pustulata]
MPPPKSFRALIGLPPSTATPTNSALILIDAQTEYASGLLATTNVAATRAAIKSLLHKYRAAGGDVVHVLHRTPEGAPVFTDGGTEAEMEELRGVEGEAAEKTIHKTMPSSFAGTDLHEYLEKTGKKKVVLTGYMAHVCVSTTARQAAELGYDVILAEDAIGDRDIPGMSGEEVTRAALLELGDAFGTVVNSSEIK